MDPSFPPDHIGQKMEGEFAASIGTESELRGRNPLNGKGITISEARFQITWPLTTQLGTDLLSALYRQDLSTRKGEFK